eukprot:1183964-Prorocentrum_minimum.AAC.2
MKCSNYTSDRDMMKLREYRSRPTKISCIANICRDRPCLVGGGAGGLRKSEENEGTPAGVVYRAHQGPSTTDHP